MKNSKVTISLFFIASVLFYITAIIGFISGNKTGMSIMYFCLGSSNLCLGTTLLNQSRKSQKDAAQEEPVQEPADNTTIEGEE